MAEDDLVDMAEDDLVEYEVEDPNHFEGVVDDTVNHIQEITVPDNNVSYNLAEDSVADEEYVPNMNEDVDADPTLPEINGNPLPQELTDEKRTLENDVTQDTDEFDGSLDTIGVIDDTQADPDAPEVHESDKEEKMSGVNKWPGWPGDNVYRLLIPVQKVGSIIGRKGEFIKKIIEETRCRVKILDGPPGSMERAVMVSAKEELDESIPPAIAGLLQVHKRLIDFDLDYEDPPQCEGVVSTRFLVAGTHAGSLIGKQGATIKAIQDTSNCTIRILRSGNLPLLALPDDSLVEIQGEPGGVHKAVEMIATHLRTFLVDHSVISIFETQMQKLNSRIAQRMPQDDRRGSPYQAAGRDSRYGFSPRNTYTQHPEPAGHFNDFYTPPDLLYPDNQPHYPGYGREPSMEYQSSSGQHQQSISAKAAHYMQIPLIYADAVIGESGANISYARRCSGAAIAVQETRGRPDQMTVEITGTVTEIQIAEQLIKDFIDNAANAAQNTSSEAYGRNNGGY